MQIIRYIDCILTSIFELVTDRCGFWGPGGISSGFSLFLERFQSGLFSPESKRRKIYSSEGKPECFPLKGWVHMTIYRPQSIYPISTPVAVLNSIFRFFDRAWWQLLCTFYLTYFSFRFCEQSLTYVTVRDIDSYPAIRGEDESNKSDIIKISSTVLEL